MTNLQLVDEKKWEEFSNLLEIPKRIGVSIDGASKETYETNRAGADWERLKKNLTYLCELRKKPESHVDYVCLNFIVQENNYREMGEFVAMAEDIGADAVEFQKLSNWGTFSEQEFLERDVLNKKHSEYEMAVKELKQILNKGSEKIDIIQNIL